jgi:putative endonuclease
MTNPIIGAFCVEKSYCVYIMSNVSKVLYAGVTNGLEKRVRTQIQAHPGFAENYNLFKRVHFQASGDIRDAIRREKQIKGWVRLQESGTH